MSTVSAGLPDFISGLFFVHNLLNTCCASDFIGKYQKKHEYLSYYWMGVKDSLSKAMEPDSRMKNGFRP